MVWLAPRDAVSAGGPIETDTGDRFNGSLVGAQRHYGRQSRCGPVSPALAICTVLCPPVSSTINASFNGVWERGGTGGAVVPVDDTYVHVSIGIHAVLRRILFINVSL